MSSLDRSGRVDMKDGISCCRFLSEHCLFDRAYHRYLIERLAQIQCVEFVIHHESSRQTSLVVIMIIIRYLASFYLITTWSPKASSRVDSTRQQHVTILITHPRYNYPTNPASTFPSDYTPLHTYLPIPPPYYHTSSPASSCTNDTSPPSGPS